MKKAIEYKPQLNNPESFIVYKFSLMPETVINKDTYNTSYNHLFMNNEFIKLLKNKLLSNEMCNNISLEMLVIIKDIVSESIRFHNSFNERSQSFSKKYRGKKIRFGSKRFRNRKTELYFYKYLCLKESYDLELPIEKIKEFDIDTANEVLSILKSIMKPGFNYNLSRQIERDILNSLRRDINLEKMSTTFEMDSYALKHNTNHFRALICSKKIFDYMKILFESGKLSDSSIDFCISVLTYSIDAANGILSIPLTYIVDDNDTKTFDKEEANKLKNKMICLKYKKASNSNYI